MKAIICRHGKPEGTEYGKRFLGITDEVISEEGLKQAHILGERISGIMKDLPVRIISSPLRRAASTALVLRDDLKCGCIETDCRLAEIDMGEWDGKYFGDIMHDYPDEFEARGRDLWNYKVPGGESFSEAARRFRAVILSLDESSGRDEPVIAVSHQGIIRAGLSLMTDIPFSEWMNRKINYAGAIILEVRDGRIAIEGDII